MLRLSLLAALPATLALIAPTTVRTKVQLRDYTLDDAPIGGPLEPVANYILVKIDDGIDATKGGVFLPDQAKEKPSAGIVVAAGEGKSHPDTGVVIPNPVGEGDRVLYGKFDGTSVKYNGEDHQLIKDDGTLAASRGAFTSFKRVVSGNDGSGWSFFRFRADSDRVETATPRAGSRGPSRRPGSPCKNWTPCGCRSSRAGGSTSACTGPLRGYRKRLYWASTALTRRLH